MSLWKAPLRRRQFLARALGALTGGSLIAKAERAAAFDEPYVGEIKMWSGTWAPAGWLFCEGQLLPIAENETLFFLIGTTYGGDGETTFALPDLRGRAPVHFGNGPAGSWQLAETRGSEEVVLTPSQLPAHTHTPGASSLPGNVTSPVGMVPARDSSGAPRYGAAPDTTMAAAALLAVGGSQSHGNMQPYLGINFIISLYGSFPSQV